MPVTFTRPSPLQPAPRLKEQPVPRRLMAALALLCVALIALVLLWPDGSTQQGPGSLSRYRLFGPRGPACTRLIVAEDVSGSMTAFASARNSAMTEIRAWSATNLRPGDEIGVLEFAGNAVWQSTPTPVLSPPGPAAGQLDGSGTALQPVLHLVGGLPKSSCDTVLVFLSDGLVTDFPATSAAALTELSDNDIHDMFWLVPGSSMPISDVWPKVFPAARPVRFDGRDPAATGLAFGRVVSAVTRQSLQRI